MSTMTTVEPEPSSGPTAGDARPSAPAPKRRKGPHRPPWMDRPTPLMAALKALALVVIVIVMLYPFVYVIAFSFADASSVTSGQLLPKSFSLAAYESILAGGVVSRSLGITAGITIIGTVLSLLLTSMLAYGLTRTKDVPFSKFALVLVLATMFFGAGIIPDYLLIKELGLLDSYWSLILPGLVSAFNMIVMRNFFMELPQELLESARIDGASEFRIFSSIVLPLSKAVIAVIALFYAVGYWNSFFNALLYINDSTKWPIQLVLNQYVVQSNSLTDLQAPDRPAPPKETVQMAIVVIATLPILVVYPFAQRFFTKGVLTGAVKG